MAAAVDCFYVSVWNEFGHRLQMEPSWTRGRAAWSRTRRLLFAIDCRKYIRVPSIQA
jgi:hypothetical protein